MSKRKFLSINVKFDVYQSCFKSGLIVAPNKYKGKYLYIIGIDISMDDIYFLDYCKFIIVQLSEFQILSVYRNIFCEQKLKTKQEQQISIHNLFHEILLKCKYFERPHLITKYFKLTEFKSYSRDEICKLIDFSNNELSGYKHIDINTGLRFSGENTYDINGNILN